MEKFSNWLYQNRKDCAKGMTFIIIMVMAITGCKQYSQWLRLPPDNPIEEAIEDVIEEETGIDIDLSPNEAVAYSTLRCPWRFQVNIPLFTF